MQKDGIMLVQDLRLPENFKFVEREVSIEGPTCTICSDCCRCETGGA